MHLAAGEIERAPDHGEHAEAEHIDLEQAQGLEIVLVPLNDGALRHRRVLRRHELSERPARDDEAAGVL